MSNRSPSYSPQVPVGGVASTREIVAAFDFDGTLAWGNSGLRFLHFFLGSRAYYWLGLTHLPTTLRFFLRMGDEAAMEVINRAVFTGRLETEVAEAAERFQREVLPRHLISASFERLLWHRDQGHRCVIVSRGYEFFLRPWARGLGLSDVVATRLEVGPDGRFTGGMREPSCDSEVKRERLQALLGPREGYELHAYGDSVGDHAMLAEADHAWMRGLRGFAPWSKKPGAKGRG